MHRERRCRRNRRQRNSGVDLGDVPAALPCTQATHLHVRGTVGIRGSSALKIRMLLPAPVQSAGVNLAIKKRVASAGGSVFVGGRR
jgi:hypothetical protein